MHAASCWLRTHFTRASAGGLIVSGKMKPIVLSKGAP